MKHTYAVVFERLPSNYAAYAPDVPGCASVGDDWPEMLAMIREGLSFHIEGMLEHGEEFPEPTMTVYDAMRYHADVIADITAEGREDAEFDLPTEVTIAMVEVEIKVPTSAALKEPAGVGD